MRDRQRPGVLGAGPLVLPATAIVFDNDGVLVDSAMSVMRAWSEWADHWGLEPAAVLAFAHSGPSRETVARFIAVGDRDRAQADIDQLELADASNVRPIRGAAELAWRLVAVPWAVVTSGTGSLASARLAAAGLPRPSVFVTADDVRRGKPDPEGYATAMRTLGADPASVVVLEDSPAGIQAARAAGVGCVVGVGSRVLDAGARVVIRDLRAVSWDGALIIQPEGMIG